MQDRGTNSNRGRDRGLRRRGQLDRHRDDQHEEHPRCDWSVRETRAVVRPEGTARTIENRLDVRRHEDIDPFRQSIRILLPWLYWYGGRSRRGSGGRWRCRRHLEPVQLIQPPVQPAPDQPTPCLYRCSAAGPVTHRAGSP